MTEVICAYCNKKFLKLNNEIEERRQDFCSRNCYFSYQRSDKFYLRNGEKIKCCNCGKEIYRCKTDLAKVENPCCSKKCSNEFRKKSKLVAGNNNPNYKGGSVELVCAICGKSFLKSRGSYNMALKRNLTKTFTCSKECSSKNRGHIIWRDSKEVMMCEHCGKEFKQYKSQRRRKHILCSKNCSTKFNGKLRIVKRLEEICLNCGRIFLRTKRNLDISKKHFCCQKCHHQYFVGKNSTFWKGGISPLAPRLRNTKEGIEWKRKVLERDNYICVECGGTENIQTHHIKELTTLIKQYNIKTVAQGKKCIELWNIENGQTLCLHCHAEKHPDQRTWLLKSVG